MALVQEPYHLTLYVHKTGKKSRLPLHNIRSSSWSWQRNLILLLSLVSLCLQKSSESKRQVTFAQKQLMASAGKPRRLSAVSVNSRGSSQSLQPQTQRSLVFLHLTSDQQITIQSLVQSSKQKTTLSHFFFYYLKTNYNPFLNELSEAIDNNIHSLTYSHVLIYFLTNRLQSIPQLSESNRQHSLIHLLTFLQLPSEQQITIHSSIM